jgi:ABC-2 type transport system permease protein
LIPFWIVGFVVLSICIFVAWLFYDFFPIGTLGTLYLFVAVFVFAMSGFGWSFPTMPAPCNKPCSSCFSRRHLCLFEGYTAVCQYDEMGAAIGHISPLKYIIEVIGLSI